MKKINCLGFLGLIALAMAIGSPSSVHALSSEYLRNGECYLLIGEGHDSLKGVYRLNNPELPKPAFYNPAPKVLDKDEILNTLGFDVDLNRVIYTFTEHKQGNWGWDTAPIYRQVLDSSVSNNASDYGYHSYIHYDHRSWKTRNSDSSNCANVYRSGNAGRGIKKSGSGNWSGFTGAGQGTPTSKPSGYTMPAMTGNTAATLGEYSGKPWFAIPNESWYSCWKTSRTESGQNGGIFYYVMGDRVKAKYHDYYLYKWTPKNILNDDPGYGKGSDGGGFDTGNVVAQTKEENIERTVYAGCLDGCGGASGSGSAEALAKISDTAFQPPLKGGGNRTYFYTRTVGKTDGSILMNNSAYNPGNDNPLIGYRDSTDTNWLCISLRDSSSDYVYCCGTKTIKEWYKDATGVNLNSMNITAVCASNQWDQEGGIVYAYDKGNKKVYKFERNETSGTPITSKSYISYDVSDILRSVDANTSLTIDDIGADGFGSMYFAISHPSLNVSDWNPPAHFKPGQAIDIKETAHDTGKKETSFQLLYKQEYGKVVFEKDYLTGNITEIGRKNFATRYYTVSGKICDEGWNEISRLRNFSNILTPLASWSAKIAGYNYTSNWPASYYLHGVGRFTGYSELNYSNPGQAKIAVINVPTPPKVISLGNKKSYIDFIGPYAGIIPMPDKVNRNTNQGDGLLKGLKYVNLDSLYFYMIENYPLDDGAQDPTAQPDWDGDSRQGGFITSIKDPAPKSAEHPDGVEYNWKTWMVMDLYGNAVCRISQESTTHNPYNYFYSPVYGKFIMTCSVKYHWYDYDALDFGSTIADLDSVLHKNEWGVPVIAGSIAAQGSNNRLAQIKSMSDFAFMNNPTDSEGNPINVNYSPITAEGEYLAMEPFVAGSGKDSIPDQNYQIANITRCDEIPGYATSSYLTDNSYWSQVPSDGCFGIEAGQSYFWRIDIASQTNMFMDISKSNNTTPTASNYNYLAHQMLTEGSPFYVNGKSGFKFLNREGDIRWADKTIFISAKLIYKVPNGTGVKEISLPLTQGNSTSDFEQPVDIVDETVLFSKNSPLYAQTIGNLPPTDPFEARIEISMRRQYKYDMWAYYNGQPTFSVTDLPGWLKVTGSAKVIIVDTEKPSLDLAKTAPNNLFGITGRPLTAGVGPNGKTNPSYVSFTVTDNNPWEAIENQDGLSIADHLRNYAINNGYNDDLTWNTKGIQSYAALFGTDSALKTSYSSIKGSLTGYTGIRNQIKTAKNNKQKSSHLNLKPVFSKAARDVRLSFQSAQRNTSGEAKGKVTVDKAGTLFNNLGRQFNTDSKNTNFYAVHFHNGNKSSKYLDSYNQSYSNTIGGTVVYDSSTEYRVDTANLKIGSTGDNTIPDGYANNTPGYVTYSGNSITEIRPYKFFVRMIDSSGNFVDDKELNLVLNVKDDIPPIGYGSVIDQKEKIASTFPYQTDSSRGVYALTEKTPVYEFNDQNYFAMGLDDALKRANWNPSTTSAFGYVNDKSTNSYQAMMSLGDKIATAVDNDVYKNQIANKLSPKPTEDNVECSFNVYVSDNCGLATATLKFNYYSNDGRGATQQELNKTIYSSFTNANVYDSNSVCASTTSSVNTVFRGKTDQFPMAIPITITATDNARDWDYYDGGSVTGTGDWKWGSIHKGADSNNTRVFKTSLPVYGSNLNIRTLDKTISDSKE